ncbi:hypothetical protein [Parasphingorhabdus pacifica]
MPCLDAFASGDILDFLTLLTERAAELLDVTAGGVILSDQGGGWRPTAVPLRSRREVIGAPTLLNTEPVAVDEASTQLGLALAYVATVGILHQRRAHRGDLLAGQLQACTTGGT